MRQATCRHVTESWKQWIKKTADPLVWPQISLDSTRIVISISWMLSVFTPPQFIFFCTLQSSIPSGQLPLLGTWNLPRVHADHCRLGNGVFRRRGKPSQGVCVRGMDVSSCPYCTEHPLRKCTLFIRHGSILESSMSKTHTNVCCTLGFSRDRTNSNSAGDREEVGM